MPNPIKLGRKERMTFSKINEVAEMPNLIQIQTDSYKWFVEEGLREVFEDVSPIKEYSDNLVLEFIDYSLSDPPKYGQEECKERDVTYAAPLKVKVRLINKENGEISIEYMKRILRDHYEGTFLEGPYFNPLKAGAQMPELIRLPDPNEYEHIVEDFNCIKRWDSAPELPGVIEMGKYLANKDVLPSIAHTAAEYDHVKAAYEAGYTHATHFYNGMPGFHNVREFKHAGTVEAVYLMENMTVEMIADGIHVPPTLLKLVYHTKGVERTAMVTDALAVAASDSNKAFDPRVIIEDGVCKLADRSALAGSIATMDRLIATAVHMADIPLQDACRMVAETPARIMGIYDRKGSLQRGKDADILILDKDIKLHAVYSMGNRVILDDKI